MGLLKTTTALGRNFLKLWAGPPRPSAETPLRICRFEQMEARRMLAADIHLGAVYFEPAAGQDQTPNTIQITFNGGAAGTQLNQVVIQQDKAGDGLTIGDTFFDSAPGGQGSFNSHDFQLVSLGGVDSYSVSYADGGTTMILTFQGFDAGDKFTFAIDVDEKGFNGSNAVAEGNEFEGSTITGSFTAPHYQADQVTGTFYDFFDQNFAGHGLTNLPNDNYLLPGDPPGAAKDPVFTAGAVGQLTQVALPIDLEGTVYEDNNLNNQQDGLENGIAGVTVSLWKLQGGSYVNTGLSDVTDANGDYSFNNLQPGTYRVVEGAAAGYLDVGAQAGNVSGVTYGSVLDVNTLTEITLLGGEHSVENNFGEVKPGSISGNVMADINGNCHDGIGETPLQGVTVYLLDAAGNRIDQTLTDVNGDYSFTGLLPGTYGVEEIQPVGFLQGDAEAGHPMNGMVVSDDKVTHIQLIAGANLVNYDFCEVVPASISGRVHADLNQNCTYEPGLGEIALSGVVVHLVDAITGVPVLDANGNPLVTVTDANGEYAFLNLHPGLYTVVEEQPWGYLSQGASPGSAGGFGDPNGNYISFIDLLGGVNSIDNDFCEVPPAALSGHVYVDANNNGARDLGEPPISGVTMQLLDGNGNPTGIVTVTNVNGYYEFTNLYPGDYGVAEGATPGYLQGTNTPGSAGGNVVGDTIVFVSLGAAQAGIDYDFGEILPATISGFVFQDGPAIQTSASTLDPATILANKDGVLDAGDIRLPGVRIRLGDAGGQPILDGNGNFVEAVTDANGYYQFTGLMPGTYSLFQVQPGGYISSINTAGTTGGLAPQPGQSLSPQMLALAGSNPYDAIVLVAVGAGSTSQFNNFSEVLITPPPRIPPPPVIPPLTPVPPSFLTPNPYGPPGTPPSPNSALPIMGPPGGFSPFLGDMEFAGNNPRGYSWHLSVVDGGRPRGETPQDGQIYSVAEVRSSVFADAALLLNQGRFVVEGTDGEGPRIIPFGRPGAIPIAGDFNGDGAAEVGVFFAGQWYIDLNGNGRWDDDDLWASLGKQGDRPVTGDWDGDGKTDIGIFGPSWEGDPRAAAAEPGLPDPANTPSGAKKNVPPLVSQAASGLRTLKRTASGAMRADLIDHVFYFGAASDMPIAGDWNGDGVDTIGVFSNGVWILDVNGNGRWEPGEPMIELGQPGDIPVVGDWDADGVDGLGVYRNGVFHLDTNHDQVLDAQDKVFEMGGAGDTPVVGDWNGDGREDVGVYHGDGATTWKPL